MNADDRRRQASSALALAHQGVGPASLAGSVPASTRRSTHGGQSPLFDSSSRRVRGETRTPAPSLRGGATATGSTDGLTLGQMLTGVWEGLSVTGSATCPLCGAAMRRESGRAEGRCGGCGTTLS